MQFISFIMHNTPTFKIKQQQKNKKQFFYGCKQIKNQNKNNFNLSFQKLCLSFSYCEKKSC